jgi:hypothetical protein
VIAFVYVGCQDELIIIGEQRFAEAPAAATIYFLEDRHEAERVRRALLSGEPIGLLASREPAAIAASVSADHQAT